MQQSIQKRYHSTHMKLFHSNNSHQYECKICTYKTKHKGNMKIHVKGVHQKVVK